MTRLSKANLPKEAKLLIAKVRLCSVFIDLEMTKPSDVERGKRIAKIMNELDMAVDSFEHFGMPSWEKRLMRRQPSRLSAIKERANHA